VEVVLDLLDNPAFQETPQHMGMPILWQGEEMIWRKFEKRDCPICGRETLHQIEEYKLVNKTMETSRCLEHNYARATTKEVLCTKETKTGCT
jgi:hypothetical protein